MKQPRAQFTKVVDHETEKFFQTKNEVMHEYAPIIGATGFMLYSFYKSMANRATGNTAWPGYKLIKAHLGFDESTILRVLFFLTDKKNKNNRVFQNNNRARAPCCCFVFSLVIRFVICFVPCLVELA